MDLSKKTQCGRRYKGNIKRINRDESDLQKKVNRALKDLGIGYWRVPDNTRIKELKGFPDNLCLIKISDDFCLAKGIELKTKTGLHGNQVQKMYDYSHSIVQDETELAKIMIEFMKQANKCSACLKRS